jgi:hypothetical protein
VKTDLVVGFRNRTTQSVLKVVKASPRIKDHQGEVSCLESHPRFGYVKRTSQEIMNTDDESVYNVYRVTPATCECRGEGRRKIRTPGAEGDLCTVTAEVCD